MRFLGVVAAVLVVAFGSPVADASMIFPARLAAQAARWQPRSLARAASSDDTTTFLGRLRKSDFWTETASALERIVAALNDGELPECIAPSISWGSTYDGMLINGAKLRNRPGLFVRSPDAWGTPEVILAMSEGVRAVRRLFPGGPDLVITDISRRDGGRLYPHRSHQSGRDVDMSLYLRWVPHAEMLRGASAASLDVERTWALIESLIADDKVSLVLLDYELQRPIYEYLRDEKGMSPEALKGLVAYPNGRNWRESLIRHERRHGNHLHVRFASPRAVANAQAWMWELERRQGSYGAAVASR